MHVFAQPAEQAAEIAAREGVIEIVKIGASGGIELGGEEVVERIGREIPDLAAGPLAVLQAAFGVVGGGDAESTAADQTSTRYSSDSTLDRTPRTGLLALTPSRFSQAPFRAAPASLLAALPL
jgi:hypothetical protein